VLLLAVLPFLLLCFYNQPYLDDYALATLVREQGLWQAQAQLYQQLNGRFFSSFLLTGLNPLSYGWQNQFGLATLAIDLLTLLALWASFGSLLGQAIGRRERALLTGGVFLIFVAVIPDIHSALYWFASQSTHHLASLCLLLIPVGVERAHRAKGRLTRWGWLGLCALGAVAMGGSGELSTLLMGWLLAAFAGISLAQREYYYASIWGALLLLLLGTTLLNVTSPGSLHRLQPTSGKAPSIVAGLRQYWQPAWLAKALQLLLWQPSTLLILVMPMPCYPLAARAAAVRPAGFRLPLLTSGAILAGGIILGAALMQLEIEDQNIAPRCANVLLWWVLLGWLAACWAALPSRVIESTAAIHPVAKISAVLLGILVLAPVNRAWRELLIEAPAWHQQCQRRYALLQQVAQQHPHTNVQLAPIYHVMPRYVLVRGYDIATTFNKPYNRDMARYFGVDSVRVDPAAHGAAF
jgi:uncharacterized membrane protein